ncbi:transketolase [Shewanella intestini]|uniref:Transketolase n=1 Tax=Shewanella intestini TaxID=2017544 RepID=A0ABS5HY80_9GAMM|nr:MULTISPECIES: transketolase [Shewanella]MBR9726735.1 transketolase [Shewanella intestini]MRG34699.1 transketolase [Shewanella sp. XMDDZSB0408]
MSHQLDTLASQIRKDAIWSIYHAKSGHPGGVLSCVDILTVLFHDVLAPVEKRLGSYSDDFFILSKGHAAPALYAVAASKGLCERAQLKGLRKIESSFQGHPDVTHLPWVEVSTGSLGQGISVATGIAKSQKLLNSAQHVFALLGDGEMQEGQVWEAAMFAAHHKLNNLTAIVDYNKLQSDASNDDICALEPLADKWRAFGWQVVEVDGHDIDALQQHLHASKHNKAQSPMVIIAHTIKGKGVDFMEDIPLWHGSVTLTDKQYEDAMLALGCSAQEIKEYENV